MQKRRLMRFYSHKPPRCWSLCCFPFLIRLFNGGCFYTFLFVFLCRSALLLSFIGCFFHAILTAVFHAVSVCNKDSSAVSTSAFSFSFFRRFLPVIFRATILIAEHRIGHFWFKGLPAALTHNLKRFTYFPGAIPQCFVPFSALHTMLAQVFLSLLLLRCKFRRRCRKVSNKV